MSEWSGDKLNRPEAMAVFTAQMRRSLSEQAEFVARVRRDAEAMWKANPPEAYSSFEAWWRHKWMSGPFAEIQEHLEKAAALTFALEARYRRGRHEIPARRTAAQAPPLELPRPAERTNRPNGVRPSARPAADESFLDLIQKKGRSA